jgi:hypothetical protein
MIMARIIYQNAAGEKLPGVTTVLNAWGGNKGALMWWAWDCGMKGLDYKKVSKEAADIGTIAHLMVEADLHGKVFDTSAYPVEQVDKAENAFLAFLEWKRLVDFQVVGTEISLVDEELGVGGTCDHVLMKGKRVMADLKTSKAVYGEYWAQVAVYGHLWNLHHPDQPIEGGYYILQIGKEDASFSYHHKINLDRYLEFFKHLLAAYKIAKEVKI